MSLLFNGHTSMACNNVSKHFFTNNSTVTFSFAIRPTLPKIALKDRYTTLTVLNLETLEYRRLSSDLTMYYKVFHNLTPWVPSDYFNIVIPPHNLHSVHHDFNIRKPLCRTNIFANDFLTVASLHGIVCLVLSLIQSLLLRLSVLLYQLICPNF